MSGIHARFGVRASFRSLFGAAALAAFALSACSSAPKPVAEVVARKNQAAEYSKLGDGFLAKRDYASALRFYEESLRENRAVDNTGGVVISMNSIGRVYLAAGRQDDAEATFREALDYAGPLRDPSFRALSLANLGEALYARGEEDAALDAFQEAVPLAARDERTLAVLLHDRAVVYRDREEWDAAEADLRRAAGINQRLKRLAEYGANLFLLGNIAHKRGNSQAAVDLLRQALEADRKAENSAGIAADLEALAVLSRGQGAREDAFHYFRRAFDVFVSLDSAEAALRCAEALSALAAELERPGDVLRYRDYAVRIRTSLDARP
jgi:tetratricopeptide (TPR) repeat protein